MFGSIRCLLGIHDLEIRARDHNVLELSCRRCQRYNRVVLDTRHRHAINGDQVPCRGFQTQPCGYDCTCHRQWLDFQGIPVPFNYPVPGSAVTAEQILLELLPASKKVVALSPDTALSPASAGDVAALRGVIAKSEYATTGSQTNEALSNGITRETQSTG